MYEVFVSLFYVNPCPQKDKYNNITLFGTFFKKAKHQPHLWVSTCNPRICDTAEIKFRSVQAI